VGERFASGTHSKLYRGIYKDSYKVAVKSLPMTMESPIGPISDRDWDRQHHRRSAGDLQDAAAASMAPSDAASQLNHSIERLFMQEVVTLSRLEHANVIKVRYVVPHLPRIRISPPPAIL
jgi:hypothetical protein